MENPSPLGSQVSASMCSSLSLPSEPPDIGNWFTSYGYETTVESEGFVIRESIEEREKNRYEIGKTGCKDELDFVIENTKSNVFANNHEKQSSSEILDSSYLPSGLSEPPDIRNWFSSYVYDSFVLDTNDDVKDSVSPESECVKEEEKNVGAFRERISISSNGPFKDDGHDKKSLWQISDSMDSPALFTEPPDVKNLFSSYVYDSFVLDTNDDVKDSVSHESERVKEEENVGAFRESRSISSNGPFKDDGHDKKSLCKISDSMDSPALFTEPPDVKNWFSSYVYESPVLDTSYEFGHSPHIEREPKKDELVVEDSEGEKEETMDIIKQVRRRDDEINVENVHSNGILEHNSSSGKESIGKGIERIERNESTSSHNNLCSVKIFKQSLDGRTLQINGMTPSKDAEESSINDGGSMSTPMQEFSQEARSSGNNSKKSPTMECLASGSGARKRIHRRNDKENENTDNGFVATRKMECARTENEDLKRRPHGILLKCCTRNNENDVTVNRKVLTETSNFQVSEAIGVTGKWRCPQKSKPNRGPPLKQLRLERWIHKV